MGATGPQGEPGAVGPPGPAGGPLLMVSDANGTELGPSYGYSRGAVTLRERRPPPSDSTLWVPRNATTGRIAIDVDLYFPLDDCQKPPSGIWAGDVLPGEVAVGDVVANFDVPLLITVAPETRYAASVRRGATGQCENLSPGRDISGFTGVEITDIPLTRPGPFTLTPAQL